MTKSAWKIGDRGGFGDPRCDCHAVKSDNRHGPMCAVTLAKAPPSVSSASGPKYKGKRPDIEGLDAMKKSAWKIGDRVKHRAYGYTAVVRDVLPSGSVLVGAPRGAVYVNHLDLEPADAEGAHFYVYLQRRDSEHVVYERTCGTAQAARDRVAELESRATVARAWYQTTPSPGALK